MKCPCIAIPIKKGEPARKFLLELAILDKTLKISSEDGELYLPIERELTPEELDELPKGAKQVEREFESHEKILTLEDILGFTPGYEVVGDIALIEADEPDAKKIADALLQIHKNVQTVLGAVSAVEGEFRTRRFKVLAGEDRTETVHKDHGFKYKVDLERAYFTPRLSTERQRIVLQIGEDDVVLDMFAGVGPYSIPIAKKCKKVIAMDKNPDAIHFLKENVDLNSIENIEVFEGDANEIALNFEGIADHVIMNLPHSADAFLDAAIFVTAPQGIIHYYGMTHEDDLFDSSIGLIEAAAKKVGRSVEVVECRTVRSYAPHQYNVCIEVRID
ncbi:class I SAM-dependent methyltransferase family protein [Methanococcoides orientis]|uniref:class I SAM-dependent methyltransferase n=1 Tax=Methanococcoides orientis TaxID=2822137 RepID=UPI001E42304E|nr:class I SAM-dependent methyltransferase family protein [Methanococcoides orientis]UGV39711.1 class I SAM-dependent methyltransferase family protein [Methanococcoides orientis]